jgi:23S rRNA pseudouridine1911/1915/1917 synthase
MPTKMQEIIYQDENILVIDKPAGIDILTLAESFGPSPLPRAGIVHRLDKDTSGVLLVAKNQTTLDFLQKQFKERKVEKKYTALISGHLKSDSVIVETLIGRSPQDRRKQKAFPLNDLRPLGKRTAKTEFKVLQKFADYDLIEASPKTGRKHQIRAHLAHLGHPIVGDKLYGFKNQPCPKDLKRQFLHASSLKIALPDNQIKEFKSILAKELNICLQNLNLS